MPTTLAAFTADTVLSASDITDRVDELETWLNGGLAVGDLQTSATWVTTRHIRRPDFLPQPMRANMPSQLHHYGRIGNALQDGHYISNDPIGNDWVWVHGLCRTLNIQPRVTTASAQIIFLASWYCFDSRPEAGSGATSEGAEAGLYALFVDGTQVPGTERPLYSSNDDLRSRKFHSVAATVDAVTRGTHNIGIKFYMNADTGARVWNHINTRARQFECRVQYL